MEDLSGKLKAKSWRNNKRSYVENAAGCKARLSVRVYSPQKWGFHTMEDEKCRYEEENAAEHDLGRGKL